MIRDTTKVGERTIHSDKELLETFYLQKDRFMPRIRYQLKRSSIQEEAHDIFTDSLLILREKYFKNGKSDYTELRKILFGICRIQTFRYIAEKNNESNISYQDNLQDIPLGIRNAYQNWYLNYQREYFKDPIKREKHNAHYRTEEYKLKRQYRENILREQGDLRAKTNARVKAYNERKKDDPEWIYERNKKMREKYREKHPNAIPRNRNKIPFSV